MRFQLWAVILGLVLGSRLAADEAAKPAATDEELSRQVSQLLEQLNDDQASERDAAEAKLLELAGKSSAETDRFLQLLPADNDQMPLAVRDRLARIRQQVEEGVAKAAVEGTKVTLSAKDMPLKEVFDAIEKQTGNKFIDNRQEEEGEASKGKITIELKDEPFWSAIDNIFDQGVLGVYSYGGEDALSIVGRASDDAPRSGAANYVGPFRIEALEIQGQRNLRQPQRKSLKLQLEVAWEPRLRPIVLTQPVGDVTLTTDTGAQLKVTQPDAVLDVEVPGGTQAAELVLPFELPDRNAKKITSLKGTLRALVPGRQATFRFDDITKSIGKSQRLGGVEVTLDDVRQNNAIWEVHMRLAFDEDNDSLQSHRGWAFQNISVLKGKDGEPIDNAGFETTRQTRNEVGLAYLYDLPDGVEGLSWEYETPAAIVELPVEYELKDIELP